MAKPAKKERYRLEPLLQVKYRVKRQSEIALAKAIRKLKEEEEKLEELKKERDAIIERRDQARQEMAGKVVRGESQISDSNSHLNFIRKLLEDQEEKEKEIEEQEKEVKKAKEALAQAKRDYIAACKEVKIMEKHKELWKKKLMKRLAKEEAKVLNELGNVLHQLKGMAKQQGDWQ